MDPRLEKHHLESETTHQGVTCDHCKSKNFPGTRYKCRICHNYDLCDACEKLWNHECATKGESEIHPSDHIFTTIPLVNFDSSLLKSDFFFTGSEVICEEHAGGITTCLCGHCSICNQYTSVDGNKYCAKCSRRFYACAECGKVGKQ